MGLKVLKAFATGLGEEEDEMVIKGVIGLHRLLLNLFLFAVLYRSLSTHFVACKFAGIVSGNILTEDSLKINHFSHSHIGLSVISGF